MKGLIAKKRANGLSFLWGIGTLGNISGNYTTFSSYMQRDDADDLRSDWQAIGYDIQYAMLRGK
ncbi:MAG: hypothetical protein K2J00_00680 [Bacteroidaceae bacterium]|nr:hypothetical protein [Bacteroidaceae bacterium]